MKQKHWILLISSVLIWYGINASGFSGKAGQVVSTLQLQAMGWYKGESYHLVVNATTKTQELSMLKCREGLASCKTTLMVLPKGLLYLKGCILNDKLALFCVKDFDVAGNRASYGYAGSLHYGNIVRQDYDLSTLKIVGEPESIYSEGSDDFIASDIELVWSDDNSKLLALVKGNASAPFFKAVVYNADGTKLYASKGAVKSGGSKPIIKQWAVSNTGACAAISTEHEGRTWTATAADLQSNFQIYSFDSKGAMAGAAKVSPKDKDHLIFTPICNYTSDGSLIMAYGFHTWKGSEDITTALVVKKYGTDLKERGTQQYDFNDNFIKAVEPFQKKGREGAGGLDVNEIVPMGGSDFAVVTNQNYQYTEKGMNLISSNYAIVFSFDDSLNSNGVMLCPKGVEEGRIEATLKTAHVGKDIYMFYHEQMLHNEAANVVVATHLPPEGKPENKKAYSQMRGDKNDPDMVSFIQGAPGKYYLSAKAPGNFGPRGTTYRPVEILLKP